MKVHQYFVSMLLPLFGLFLIGCGNTAAPEPTPTAPVVSEDIAVSSENLTVSSDSVSDSEISLETSPESIEYTVSDNIVVKFSVPDQTDTFDESTATLLSLSENEVNVTGDGVTIQDNRIVLTAAGTYILEGSLDDGQIYINAGDEDKVQLVLNGVSLHCDDAPVIYGANGDKIILTLASGKINDLSDGSAYSDDSANSCIYSKVDLTINGSGTLNVTANCNNAITTKDDLKIVNGIINISAVNNALRGNDSIAILDGTITIENCDDGIKVSNETDSDKGYIFIAGGYLTITADDDCFQAYRGFVFENGTIYARCFGKSVNCDGWTIGTEKIIEWL